MAVANATVTKDMLISDVLEIEDGKYSEGIANLLLEIGMHCLGCAMAHGETLEDACQVHEADADELLAKINDFIAEQAA